MKLPQTIEGIQREGRTDCLVAAGVEPAFLGGWIKKIPGVGGLVKKGACAACSLIPNPIAAAICRKAAC